MKTRIKFSRENENVIRPTKRPDDAGYDIYADPEFLEGLPDKILSINPLQTVMIPTGIRTIVDKNYYLQLQERGSTGSKGIKYGAGVIDASYRGIINVPITNCSNKPIVIGTEENFNAAIEKGLELLKEQYPEDNITVEYVKGLYEFYPSTKGIAQFLVLPVPQVTFEEVSPEHVKNDKTERGEGKLGSSGK